MYKCIKSFAGNIVSMKKGDTIESLDKELALDYLNAGFIVEVKQETKAIKEIAKEIKEETPTVEKTATVEKKPTVKKTKKK